MTGVVISFNKHNRFGFIQNDSGDFYFRGIDAYKGVSVGDKVNFDLIDDHVKGVKRIETDG